MIKNELDFRNFEEVLEEVLGIKNPRNISSLKFQIKQTFEYLIHDMEKNCQNSDIFEIQKQRRLKELEEFLAEDDLEKVLKKCIAIRDIYIQSYQEKIKLGDSDNVRKEKLRKIRAAHKVTFISEKVPSLLDFMDGKQMC